jgi:hypothetical protein
MSDRKMPKMPDESEKMTEIKFSVPSKMLSDAIALGRAEGVSPSNLHRACWMQGLSLYSEQSNKRMINRKLTSKAEIIDLLDGIPTAKFSDAIAYLKSLKD